MASSLRNALLMMNTNATLAELAIQHPVATRVFLRHRLDFCCGGNRPLAAACQASALDPMQLLSEIQTEQERLGGNLEGWATRPLPDLIDHIVERYHVPLRQDVPNLAALARKVESVHASKSACPHGLASLLEIIVADIEAHLRKEEQILFPLIRTGRGADAGMPIRVMETEHDEHGANLRRIRDLTGDLVVPDDACASWRALYDGLTRLEAELMEHIHLENHVLFPRALNE